MIERSKYLNFYAALSIVLLATIGVTVQSVLLGTKSFGGGPEIYQHYNNYVIFKNSFFHLLENLNLYQLYPSEQFDLYKYSPSFALFMAPLAMLPDWLGLLCWNSLNSLVLFYALWHCKYIKINHKFWAVLFVLLELITSIQNAQSNALMAGLIIMAFNLLENRKTFWAVLLLSLTVYIKLFGIVAFVLILLYQSRWRAIGYTIFWFIVLTFIPLLFIDYTDLIAQYTNWGIMLKQDHDTSLGISVAGILNTVLGLQNIKIGVLILGALLFCIPLVYYKKYEMVRFRLLYLASVLLWVVIFNHKAESPTFIIALAGVVIWYFTRTVKPSLGFKLLLFFVLILSSVSSTDLFPAVWRHGFVEPYNLKVLPCVIVWFALFIEQLNSYKLKKQPV